MRVAPRCLQCLGAHSPTGRTVLLCCCLCPCLCHQTRHIINTYQETPDSLQIVRQRLQTLAEEVFLMQEVCACALHLVFVLSFSLPPRCLLTLVDCWWGCRSMLIPDSLLLLLMLLL